MGIVRRTCCTVMNFHDTEDLRSFMRNREEEVERLEAELGEYRSDLDQVLDAFKKRERELVDELEMAQNKNNVISNLLEIVTERAENTQRELYRSTRSVPVIIIPALQLKQCQFLLFLVRPVQRMV